jgi:hypothetical protein
MTRKSRDFVFRWNSPASLASRLFVIALITTKIEDDFHENADISTEDRLKVKLACREYIKPISHGKLE